VIQYLEMDFGTALLSLGTKLVSDAVSPRLNKWFDSRLADRKQKQIERVRGKLKTLTGELPPVPVANCSCKKPILQVCEFTEVGLAEEPEGRDKWRAFAFFLTNAETKHAIPAYHLEAFVTFKSASDREIANSYTPWFHNHKDDKHFHHFKSCVNLGTMEKAGVVILMVAEGICYTAKYSSPACPRGDIRLSPGQWEVTVRIEGHNIDATYVYHLTIVPNLYPSWREVV
jgi:hypothetical protein